VLSNGCEHVQADFPADVTQSTLSYHMKRLRQTDVAWSRPDRRPTPMTPKRSNLGS
jgi:hypothetical protein